MRTISRCYTELSRLASFEERFEYLRLDGAVGVETFGHDRYLNQIFYRSDAWRRVRDLVIVRDRGRDLGVEGYEIRGKIVIHHLEPVSSEDILRGTAAILDPEYLICTTHHTHNAIHYGDAGLLIRSPPERRRFDTSPWKKEGGGHGQYPDLY